MIGVLVALAAGAIALAVSTSTLAAGAAIEARLTGDFKVTGKITDSNDGTQGDVRTRTYEFMPLCPTGPCQKVVLRREGPHGSHFKSTLRLVQPGKYRGTEDSGRIPCGGGDRGTQTVHLAFSILAEELGEATAIEGRAKFDIRCAGEHTFQKAKIYGERLR
jgi:hypothetical protein